MLLKRTGLFGRYDCLDNYALPLQLWLYFSTLGDAGDLVDDPLITPLPVAMAGPFSYPWHIVC